MTDLKKNFVTFFSPGTFISEETTLPISSWNIDLAKEMAMNVLERYDATPYAFQFSTRGRRQFELDSRKLATSPMYFLGGVIETLAEVKARATSKDDILISNMETNGYARVITNTNSWKITLPFEDDYVLLDWNPPAKKKVG